MFSRVCLGGLPGPLVPGFLGELVINCGGRRKGGGGRGEGRRKEGWKFKRRSHHSLFPGLPTCIQYGVTFSFLSLAVVFLSGYVHSSSLSSDTSWSLSSGVLFLGFQRYTGVYWDVLGILRYTGVH